MKAAGLDAFRDSVVAMSPFLRDRMRRDRGWDDVKLLTVAVDRLPRWYKPGLLCIGDAAHAMSPIGGVGINLAIQDAVAAANILAAPLKRGPRHARRCWPRCRSGAPCRCGSSSGSRSSSKTICSAPCCRAARGPSRHSPAKLLNWFPLLQRIPARIIGLGVRPEHVHTPEISA